MVFAGYPWHRESRENGNNKSNGNFAKTQGILSAQVVNSLILQVKDIVIFATKIVCNSHKLCKLTQGKLPVGQGKHREFENTIWVGALYLRIFLLFFKYCETKIFQIFLELFCKAHIILCVGFIGTAVISVCMYCWHLQGIDWHQLGLVD